VTGRWSISLRATRNVAAACQDAHVRRTLANGLELDDDAGRVDVDAVHDFLANHSYWAEGRPREVVQRLLHSADRVVGLYDGTRQVGFARAFTDGTTLAYLADVYVLPEYRGRGLGVELVREMIERGRYAKLRWLLHTRDAHDLYRRFGFTQPSERLMERPRP
jgi:GNAT superfamily N-acetyltransferase